MPLPASPCRRIAAQSALLFLLLASLAFNNEDFRRCRARQRQLLESNLFYARMGRPGTLFDLQLAPFDIQFVTFGRQLLELDEQFAAFVLGLDQRERREEADAHENRRHYQGLSSDQDLHQMRSAVRRRALRALGLAAISWTVAATAFPASFNRGRWSSGIDGMPRYCSGSRDALRKNLFTRRSSSE